MGNQPSLVLIVSLLKGILVHAGRIDRKIDAIDDIAEELMANFDDVKAAVDRLDAEVAKSAASFAKLAQELKDALAAGADPAAIAEIAARVDAEAAALESARAAADPEVPPVA